MKKRPVASVLAIVQNNRNEILLIRQKTSPLKGWWLLPGGHVKFGETVKEAIVREVKEETGFAIKVSKLLGVFDVIDTKRMYHFVHAVFQCELAGGKSKAGSDALDVGWFDVNTLDKVQPDLKMILEAMGSIKSQVPQK